MFKPPAIPLPCASYPDLMFDESVSVCSGLCAPSCPSLRSSRGTSRPLLSLITCMGRRSVNFLHQPQRKHVSLTLFSWHPSVEDIFFCHDLAGGVWRVFSPHDEAKHSLHVSNTYICRLQVGKRQHGKRYVKYLTTCANYVEEKCFYRKA